MRAKPYFSFGASLHRVLQRFHDPADAGVGSVEQAVEAVESGWISAGYDSSESAALAQSEGKEIVERYVAQSLAQPSLARPLLTEKLLRADLGEFVLIGRLDRLDEHGDGSLEIVDYKTGRAEVSQDDVANDIAMGCYQLIVRKQFPDRPVRATIVALRTGAQATWAMPSSDLQEFELGIVELGREILRTDFAELVPRWISLCPECDFLPICERHPDFEAPAI